MCLQNTLDVGLAMARPDPYTAKGSGLAMCLHLKNMD